MSEVIIDISEGIATLTLNRPKKLNAITRADYDALANALREVDERDDVVVTVWQATGSYFCAGTDVKVGYRGAEYEPTVRHGFLEHAAHATTDVGHAFSSHSKVLVGVLNGPVIGIAAAFLGHCDFIYCVPSTWLSAPFSFLGIIAEGGSSVSFVNRMGLSQANEVLIWGQKKTAEDLLQNGFVNKIFPQQPAEALHATVRAYLLEQLSGLDPTSVLVIRKLIRAGLRDKNDFDAVNLRETYEQARRFASGKPQERFAMVARKEIKHKL